jgi:hypothetical protein
MALIAESPLSKAVDTAIRKLVSVEHFHAGSLVSMPMLYPSGASVVLEVSAQSSTVFICDRGGAFQEAEFIGASRQLPREAERVASEFGIHFDGRDMFVAEVAYDRLEGALINVAAASAQAAASIARRAAERQEQDTKDAMFDKLSSVFGQNGFEREIELLGASNHKWRVDAVIRFESRVIVFNAVTRNHVSITGAAAKFYDLSRLETPPRRIAVASSLKELGDWYGVVSGAADTVLEIAAANDRFLRERYAS